MGIQRLIRRLGESFERPPSPQDERDVLVPPSPEPDVSNRRAPFGRISAPDRTAGVFTSGPVDVPGAGTIPSTPTVSDTRTVSNVGTGRVVGPQPVLPDVGKGALPYGITSLGPRADDGSTR